jgi:hypothetical protein
MSFMFFGTAAKSSRATSTVTVVVALTSRPALVVAVRRKLSGVGAETLGARKLALAVPALASETGGPPTCSQRAELKVELGASPASCTALPELVAALAPGLSVIGSGPLPPCSSSGLQAERRPTPMKAAALAARPLIACRRE